MAEALIGYLAWSALRLTSSLITAGFKKLVGSDEDPAMVKWSDDVVLTARNKQQQALSRRLSPDMSPSSRALAARQHEMKGGLPTYAAAAEIGEARSEVRGVKRDIERVRATLEECRAENMDFFERFTASLEATQHGIEIMRSAPLEEAEMSLKDFDASGGDVEFLKDARSKAMTALVQGHSLDVKLSAAIIAVAAGYVYRSKMDSPGEAKHFTVNGTLANIVKHFAPIWAAPSAADTADGKKVLSFLLNLVACVCVLPSENTPVFPKLDKRLLPVFGALCAADAELRGMYPAVAGAAVRTTLEAKSMKSLFQLADEVDVDVEDCTNKGAVVRALAASGKSLVPGPAMRRSSKMEKKRNAVTPVQAPPAPDVVAPVQAAPAPARGATTDRAALVAFFYATNGPSWKKLEAWGTSAPLGGWHGVAVDGAGRVAQLDLREVNLNGQIPTALGRLVALEQLRLFDNNLRGPIPAALGGLRSLTWLNLADNELTDSIPAALGELTALETLSLNNNSLSGLIPMALGGLTKLTFLDLADNLLSGPIPKSLRRLTVLKYLYLQNNQLNGSRAGVQRMLPNCSTLVV